MPIITIVILVKSSQVKAKQGKAKQGKARQGKTWWNIHRFVAYNDNDNNNESWIILYACTVIRCGVSYSVKKKLSPIIIMQTDRQTYRRIDRQTDR